MDLEKVFWERVAKDVSKTMSNLYEKKCKEENDRIYTWLLVGERLGICKDVRTLIAEEIWQQFFDD